MPDAPSLLDLSEVEMPQMYHAGLNAADMRNVIHKAAGLPFYDLLSMFDGRMVGYTSHTSVDVVAVRVMTGASNPLLDS